MKGGLVPLCLCSLFGNCSRMFLILGMLRLFSFFIGSHGEWQGDWGDASTLWNRRLKGLLQLVDDEDDGMFWMSFDDFCHSFRHLYVCRYFDPNLWQEIKFVEHW